MKQADKIAKRDETDRVAYEILDKEAEARELKTERLRLLILSRDADQRPADGEDKC